MSYSICVYRNFFLKLSFVVLCLLLSCFRFAQAQTYILFTDSLNGKSIKAHLGDELSLAYFGYRSQMEYTHERIVAITDSSVFISIKKWEVENAMDFNKNHFKRKQFYQEILYRDIIAFRRISKGKKIVKIGLKAITIIGHFVVLRALFSADLSDIERLSIGTGIFISSNILINLMLPKHPKYKVGNGHWTISVEHH